MHVHPLALATLAFALIVDPATARATPDANDTEPSVAAALEDAGAPIRELAQIDWIAGTWRAHSVTERADGSSHDRGTNTYVFGRAMAGRYVFGADGKSRDYLYITFDPYGKRWVLMRFEGNPAYGLWVSETGWKGNRIEFTSDVAYVRGRRYHRRTTIIHTDARTFGIYDEEQLPTGTWTPDGVIELTKEHE